MRVSVSRVLSILLALFAGAAAHAQLVIEITKGQGNAVPIAVVPFGMEGQGAAAVDFAAVIAGDLARSGRFAPLERRDMTEKPTAGDQIKFQDWKYLKSDYIVVGKTLPDGDRSVVQFELYNVINGQRLIGQRLPLTAAGQRMTAHRIADLIFQQIVGIPGAFATRIAFVSMEGTG